MYRVLARTLPLLGALFTLGLAAPNMALAQDPQHNESDIDFLKRMIASLKQTERQAAQLEDNIGQFAKQQKLVEMETRNDPRRSRDDPFGSRTRNTTGNLDSDFRRAEMRIRSTKKKAIEEREELSELQRSGESLKPRDRDKIENAVSRLAREVEDMQRDMQLGRF
ncbi:MAG: hypothetical protein P8X81_03565 [Woeseiaceae bacterium]|jgi:hypothetical protein